MVANSLLCFHLRHEALFSANLIQLLLQFNHGFNEFATLAWSLLGLLEAICNLALELLRERLRVFHIVQQVPLTVLL